MVKKSKVSEHILGEPEELMSYLENVVPKDLYKVLEEHYSEYRSHRMTKEDLMLELMSAMMYKSKNFDRMVDMMIKLKSLRSSFLNKDN